MNRKRAGIVAATVVAGVAAAVGTVIVNGSASAADGVELTLRAQRMPLAGGGQDGFESRIAIVDPDNVGAPAITNGSIRLTVPASVTVYHSMGVTRFDSAEATNGNGIQQSCFSVDAVTWDCPYVSGAASFGNLYTFGQDEPMTEPPVITASLNSRGFVGADSVVFAPRVFVINYNTQPDRVIMVPLS